jgi:predicted GTPase
MRSEKSIERADVCVLIVDAVEGVTAQDKKIAGLIQEAAKPCVIVVNKLDLVKPMTRIRNFLDAILNQIRAKLFFSATPRSIFFRPIPEKILIGCSAVSTKSNDMRVAQLEPGF